MRAFVALLVVFAFVPTAQAAGCPPEGEATLAGVDGVVLVGADGHVYQDSNGVPGLQSTAGSCTDDNGRDRSWAADTLVL